MDIRAIQKRIEGGDRSAYAAVVGHYQRPLFSYLGRMGLAQARAEDIAQETFLRAWRRLSDYDPDRAAFSTWLFTIARNLALNELSRASSRHETQPGDTTPDPADERPDAPEMMIRAERHRQVRAALDTLPDTDRRALSLAYFQELDHAAIAAIEGSTAGAIKVRLHRAREKLRALLEKFDG